MDFLVKHKPDTQSLPKEIAGGLKMNGLKLREEIGLETLKILGPIVNLSRSSFLRLKSGKKQ